MLTLSVYVVVTLGVTADDPSTKTVPTPWSMLAESASVVVQLNVDDVPSVIVARLAVKESITGILFTVTVAVAVLSPLILVAVSVYVVVTEGVTVVEPSTATVPSPWSMLAESASVVAQERVDESPSVIVVGDAVKESITGSVFTVTVALSVLDP